MSGRDDFLSRLPLGIATPAARSNGDFNGADAARFIAGMAQAGVYSRAQLTGGVEQALAAALINPAEAAVLRRAIARDALLRAT